MREGGQASSVPRRHGRTLENEQMVGRRGVDGASLPRPNRYSLQRRSSPVRFIIGIDSRQAVMGKMPPPGPIRCAVH